MCEGGRGAWRVGKLIDGNFFLSHTYWNRVLLNPPSALCPFPLLNPFLAPLSAGAPSNRMCSFFSLNLLPPKPPPFSDFLYPLLSPPPYPPPFDRPPYP